jgi:hypothetical protein
MRCGCGKIMKEAEVELRGFKLKGFKCDACGEEALNPWDVERVRQAVNGEVKARKVANSLVVTLPSALAKLMRIHEGDALRWLVEKNALVLQKDWHN